jgi:hypothetical protein
MGGGSVTPNLWTVPVVSMSKREFDRLEVLTGVRSGRLRVADACGLLGLSRRQAFRLLRGMREDGAASLVSKRRGRPSNRRLPDAVRDLTMALVREHYADFGPTLAAKKLAEPRTAPLPAPRTPDRAAPCRPALPAMPRASAWSRHLWTLLCCTCVPGNLPRLPFH